MADFRERMGISLSELDTLPIPEVAALYTALAKDPSTRIGAIEMGLEMPVAISAIVLADLFDLTMNVNATKGKTPQPYPRLWMKKKASESAGKKVMMTQSQMNEFYKKRGYHTPPVGKRS